MLNRETWITKSSHSPVNLENITMFIATGRDVHSKLWENVGRLQDNYPKSQNPLDCMVVRLATDLRGILLHPPLVYEIQVALITQWIPKSWLTELSCLPSINLDK